MPFCSPTFRNHVEAWGTNVLHSLSGHVVLSSAILSVVDHPEKGMAGFDADSQGLVGVTSQMHPRES